MYPSYRSEIVVKPNWPKIIRWFLPELKSDEDALKFVEQFSKQFNVDRDSSLYGKQFVFLEFKDQLSGLYMVWSRKYSQFLDEAKETGNLLESKDGEAQVELEKRIALNKVHEDLFGTLAISPQGINAGRKTISSIPYWDIVNFLSRVEKETKAANRQIKKFPPKLQEIFDKDGIKYAPVTDIYIGNRESDMRLVDSKWLTRVGAELYLEKVIQHVFETPYYSLEFSLHFFNPDVRHRNEIPDSDWLD